MRVKVTFGMVLMVLVVMTANSLAQPFWWGNVQGVTQNPLGLTSEQLVQIQTINTEWQNEITPLWTQLQTKSLELRNLQWSSAPSSPEITAKTKEMMDLQTQIQQKSLEKQNAIRNVLTDEQKAMYGAPGSVAAWGGRGPGGMGLGRTNWAAGYGRGGGFGRRGGFARGGGFGRGGGAGYGAGYGLAPGMSPAPGMGMGMPGMGMPGMGMTPMGTTAPLGWGRGPCGMGLGRTNWGRRW